MEGGRWGGCLEGKVGEQEGWFFAVAKGPRQPQGGPGDKWKDCPHPLPSPSFDSSPPPIWELFPLHLFPRFTSSPPGPALVWCCGPSPCPFSLAGLGFYEGYVWRARPVGPIALFRGGSRKQASRGGAAAWKTTPTPLTTPVSPLSWAPSATPLGLARWNHWARSSQQTGLSPQASQSCRASPC